VEPAFSGAASRRFTALALPQFQCGIAPSEFALADFLSPSSFGYIRQRACGGRRQQRIPNRGRFAWGYRAWQTLASFGFTAATLGAHVGSGVGYKSTRSVFRSFGRQLRV